MRRREKIGSEAHELRDQISALGWEVRDTKGRTKTHAHELWVAQASRASQTSYRVTLELKTEFD